MSGIQLDPLLVMASLPSHYARSRMWRNAGSDTNEHRRTLVSPDFLTININNIGHVTKTEVSLDLNNTATWDSVVVNYTVAVNRAGKQFYIYACIPTVGRVPTFLCSANSTYPVNYSSGTSRCVGSFHCVCANVGSISGHSLTGYLAGDILPRSIQDLVHRPISGFIPGVVWGGSTDFDSLMYAPLWKAIYMASGTGANVASVYGAATSTSRDWNSFVADFGFIGCRMMDDDEFQVLCTGIEEEVNVTGSANPITTGGNISTTSRRMISNIGSEDDAGVWWQWLRTQSYRCDFDGSVVAASKTATITHAASPGGNPIYLKMLADGSPYLCCNMGNDAVGKWVSFGSNTLAVLITHDANAAVGGVQVCFDEDAAQPSRLLANMARSKNCYVPVYPNTDYMLQITHSANAATLGVPLYYDDGSDERLEFTSPTSANGTLDLSLGAIVWQYYNLPGTVGSLYRQGGHGDIKLLGGGNWIGGASAGSQCRLADCCRWDTYSSIGGRFVAEPA